MAAEWRLAFFVTCGINLPPRMSHQPDHIFAGTQGVSLVEVRVRMGCWHKFWAARRRNTNSRGCKPTVGLRKCATPAGSNMILPGFRGL
jgi:hypothetical protein